MRAMYYWGLLTGFTLGLFFSIGSMLLESSETELERSRFEVVDSYEGCDVIKWEGVASYREYKFFLDCRKNNAGN